MATGEDVARIVAGAVADVRAYLRSAKPASVQTPRYVGLPALREPLRMYVRVPYAARELVLADKPEVMHERVDGDGLWQAVIAHDTGTMALDHVGGMIYPISGDWQAPAAGAVGLRLVG